MGLDMTFFAVVDDGPLVALVESHPEAAEDLAFLHLYFAGKRGARPDDPPGDRAIGELARSMQSSHPGIEARRVSIGREWDLLHYLLSPRRRGGERHADEPAGARASGRPEGDPGTLAIRGARDLHPAVVGTQGIPLRFLPPGDAARVASWIASIPEEELRRAHESALIHASDVYKFSPDEGPERFGSVRAAFVLLSAFYEEVARHREAVVILLD